MAVGSRWSAWQYGDAAWFDGDVEAAKQFAVFGNGPDGSLYAIWLYPLWPVSPRCASGVPPSSEESFDCGGVIAADVDAFLALLAVGADERGFEGLHGVRYAGEDCPFSAGQGFAAWLR